MLSCECHTWVSIISILWRLVLSVSGASQICHTCHAPEVYLEYGKGATLQPEVCLNASQHAHQQHSDLLTAAACAMWGCLISVQMLPSTGSSTVQRG